MVDKQLDVGIKAFWYTKKVLTTWGNRYTNQLSFNEEFTSYKEYGRDTILKEYGRDTIPKEYGRDTIPKEYGKQRDIKTSHMALSLSLSNKHNPSPQLSPSFSLHIIYMLFLLRENGITTGEMKFSHLLSHQIQKYIQIFFSQNSGYALRGE